MGNLGDSVEPEARQLPFIISWPPFRSFSPSDQVDFQLEGPIHLYLHFPFCRHRCPFCFYKVIAGASQQTRESYIDILIAQLTSICRSLERGAVLRSLYLGGGTPSLLSPRELERILTAIRWIGEPSETTLEVEPGTASAEILRSYVELGVTRLSVGAQSFSDDALRASGRLHSASQALTTVQDAVLSGARSVNVDLLLGLPNVNVESVVVATEELRRRDVGEVTLYRLLHAQNLIWARRPPEQGYSLADEQFRAADSVLLGLGFRATTTFTYSSGYQHLHRVGLWSGEQLVGLGLSAYGFVRDSAYQISSDISEFRERGVLGNAAVSRAVRLDQRGRLIRDVVLGLQLQNVPPGVTTTAIESAFGMLPPEHFFDGHGHPFSLSASGRAGMASWLFQATEAIQW